MIHQIKHDGKDLPLKIGYGAMLKMQEETGMSVEQMNDEGGVSLRALESLFYHSMVNGHRAEGKEFTLEREDVTLIWEDNVHEFTLMMNKTFAAQAKKK